MLITTYVFKVLKYLYVKYLKLSIRHLIKSTIAVYQIHIGAKYILLLIEIVAFWLQIERVDLYISNFKRNT